LLLNPYYGSSCIDKPVQQNVKKLASIARERERDVSEIDRKNKGKEVTSFLL